MVPPLRLLTPASVFDGASRIKSQSQSKSLFYLIHGDQSVGAGLLANAVCQVYPVDTIASKPAPTKKTGQAALHNS